MKFVVFKLNGLRVKIYREFSAIQLFVGISDLEYVFTFFRHSRGQDLIVSEGFVVFFQVE